MSDTVKFLKAIFLSMSSVKDINNPSINKMLTDFSSAIESVEKLEADKQALEDRVKLLQKTFAHYYETNGEDEDCAVCGLNIRDSVHKRHLDGYFGNPMDELDKLTIKPQTD